MKKGLKKEFHLSEQQTICIPNRHTTNNVLFTVWHKQKKKSPVFTELYIVCDTQ